MSSSARGQKRPTQFFVAVTEYLYYGFKPKSLSSFPGISSDDITVLGHLLSSVIPEEGIRIVGAKAPQPPRVTKKINNLGGGGQQSVSTFCDFFKIATAQQKGWELTKGRKLVAVKPLNKTKKSLTAIATLSNGARYCFSLNKEDFQKFGGELGLLQSTQLNSFEIRRLIQGCNIPRPGVAKKIFEDGTSFSTFFSHSANLSVDWSIKSQEIIL